ncbi:MAG: MFS transporter [Erysipelotrichales bacterium]|nr:MFS transporter [Erysipelotrichales bacterium]
MKKVSIPRAFIFVVVYSLFANFAHPVTPTFIQNLGLPDYMFGVAFACMSTTNFLFSPFWGKISRGIGSSKVLGVCYLGYALAQYIFGAATTQWQIMAARLIGGFFISGITVNQILYVLDNSEEGRAGQNLARQVTLNVVVAAFGFMVGGLLGDISIKLAFTAQVVGLASIGIAHFIFLDDNKEKIEKLDLKDALAHSNPFQAIIDGREILTVMIVIFLVVSLSTSFATTCYEQCFNYYIKDQFGFPPSMNGMLKAAVGMITLLANMTICNYLLKKTNIIKTVLPVLVVCFAMMISIIVLEDIVPFIIMNVVFFGFNAIYQPLLQAMINILVKKEENGMLTGLYNSMRSLGNMGGSLLAGFIYGVGPKMSFVVSAIAFAIAIVGSFLMRKRALRDPRLNHAHV